MFGHIVHLYDSVNAKISTASPPEDWKRAPGRSSITWLNAVLDNFKYHDLTLNKAVHMAHNQPLWRLLALTGTMHSFWHKPEINYLLGQHFLHCVSKKRPTFALL